MGSYLSRPVTSTEPEDGEGNSLQYGASSMQGWRISQEDAHNCLAKFDEDSSLFAVYDGHGGAEVAIYLSRHFPELLKNTEMYKAGEWKEALIEAYLKMDESIKTPEVLAEVVRLSKLGKKGELEDASVEENVNELYEEATMPLEQLVQRYNAVRQMAHLHSEQLKAEKAAEEEKPGSSKALNSSSSPQKISSEEPAAGSSSSSGSGSGSSKPISEAVGESKSEPEVKLEKPDSSTKVPEELTKANGNEIVTKDETMNEAEPEPVKVNGNGLAHEEDETETLEIKEKLENGIEINTDGAEEGKGDAKSPVKVLVNGSPNDKESSREDSILLDTTTAKPRKAKVQLPPVLTLPAPQSPVRTSPRKSSEKLYKEFVNAESGTSDSEDEEPSLLQRMSMALGHVPNLDDVDDDSDSEATDDGVEDHSSSDEEDEDDEDEEEDEDESEDDLELNDIQEPGFDSGATAVMAFSRWEGNLLHLWVANAGDSRCVVCRDGVALEMSQDHKPEELVESRRIVAAGGKVTSEGRVNGGLNLSRAIGDHSYKQNSTLPLKDQMITSLPDVEYALINPETDKFLVLACDGIWNSMTSQQVVDFVGERIKNPELKLSDICEQLFRACLSPDTMGDGTGCDNMTAIIVRICKRTGAPAEDGTKLNEVEAQKEVGIKRAHSPSVPEVPEVETKRVRVDGEEETVAIAE